MGIAPTENRRLCTAHNIDTQRCTLNPDETAKIFMHYRNAKKAFGLFLSSGLLNTPDTAMQRLTDTAQILRKKYKFQGYIHLKIIPGASNAAIENAVALSNAVSINIETPGEKYLNKLTNKKNFQKDIIEPLKHISKLTEKGSKYQRVKQTTQFVVGAADESDNDIVKYMAALYDRLKLSRIYFSVYQKGLGDKALPGENIHLNHPTDLFTREHRLYQVDFLLRKYNFAGSDFEFENNGNLSLTIDPKQAWANHHPEFFPVDINKSPKHRLLRVPGLGPITVNRIIKHRRKTRINAIQDFAKPNKTLLKAKHYLTF